MSGIKFNIENNFGVIAKNYKGWTKEVNLVSWNNRKPKIDIREWDEEHKKMSKGLTFSKDEIIKLKEILNTIDVENINME